MPTASARAPHPPPPTRVSSSALQRSKASTLVSSSEGSPISVNETLPMPSRTPEGSLRSSLRGASRTMTTAPSASSTEPPTTRRNTAIHMESSGSASSRDGSHSHTLGPREKQRAAGPRPKSAAGLGLKGRFRPRQPPRTSATSTAVSSAGSRGGKCVPIREFTPDHTHSNDAAATSKEEGDNAAGEPAGGAQDDSTSAERPSLLQHSGEGLSAEQRRSPLFIPPPSSRNGFSAADRPHGGSSSSANTSGGAHHQRLGSSAAPPGRDCQPTSRGKEHNGDNEEVAAVFRLGGGYRYPAPPPVTDQLYVPEEAAVQLCGLPNLTLSTRTHYAASPFLYTPGGSDPNHTAHLRYPSEAQRTETNTAAGKFQAPIVGETRRRGGTPNTTLVLIHKEIGPPPSLPLPEDSAGPTSSVPGIVGGGGTGAAAAAGSSHPQQQPHRVSTAPVMSGDAPHGSGGRWHPMSRGGNRVVRDYGPSVTLGAEQRVSLRRRSSSGGVGGLEVEGMSEDPRQKRPVSQQLKWRFLTATAVSLSASPPELLDGTRGRSSKRSRSTTPQRKAATARSEDAEREEWNPDGDGVVFHCGGEDSDGETDERQGQGHDTRRPYTGMQLDTPEQVQISRGLLLLHPHATLGSSPNPNTSVVPSASSYGLGGGIKKRTPPAERHSLSITDAGEETRPHLRLSVVHQPPSLSTTTIDDDDDGEEYDGPVNGPHVLAKTAIATPLGHFPLQPSERLPTGPEEARAMAAAAGAAAAETESAGNAFAPMQFQSSSDSVFSGPPLPYVPTAEGAAASPIALSQDHNSPLPITAYVTSTPSAFLARPLPPFPAQLPVHMLGALDQAKRTMTPEGRLQPRASPRTTTGAAEEEGYCARKATPSRSSPSSLAAAFHTSTFSLTLPQNQFRSMAERRSGRATTSHPGSTSSSSTEVMCGHTQRRQQKEALLNARIAQLREEVLQPQSVAEEDQPLPPTAGELHITRAMHNEDVNARPLEGEVQFLWKESAIRPHPLMVAPAPMDRVAPPDPNRMLLHHSELSQPPYAAAEGARLTAQRHQMTRMEFEEKIQPFRVAKTLLTNTNARHLALLDVQEKRKQREQWLVQRIGAFYPENEEEEEPIDAAGAAGGGRAGAAAAAGDRPLPEAEASLTKALQSATSSGAMGSAAGVGSPTDGSLAPPFRIPKNFPPSFRALLEALHPPATPESTRLSRHHRHTHRHSPSAHSRSGGPLGSAASTSGQLRSIPSRAHFPPRHRPGGFGLDGPTIIHHPHLDRLRAALLAPDNEVDALLKPPGWEEMEKQGKSKANTVAPMRPISPETPASLRKSQTSQAFEQYRRSLLPSPAASVHGGAGGTTVSEETIDAVSPEKKRLDEISNLFLHLLEEAADAANYGPEERERIIDIHAAFQEQRLQQEYQNYHPVLDVAVSAAFDEQWGLEVERHKTEKDRKLEAGANAAAANAAASAQQKRACATNKLGTGSGAAGAKGKAKASASGGGRRGETLSTRPSEAGTTESVEAVAAGANASPAWLETFAGFHVNPLFPLDSAWCREVERIRQHDALLDLLRQRPVCPANELPPGLGTGVTGGMQSIASRGSFTNSANATALAASHGVAAMTSPQPQSMADSDLPPTSIVTFPQAEMGVLPSPKSEETEQGHPGRRSTASPDVVKVTPEGRAGGTRKSSISINESMNVILEDSKGDVQAAEGERGGTSPSNSSAVSGTDNATNNQTKQPSDMTGESGDGGGAGEEEEEDRTLDTSSQRRRSSRESGSEALPPTTTTARGSTASQGGAEPQTGEVVRSGGEAKGGGRPIPPPLQLNSPSVVLPANEQELMHQAQLQQSAQQLLLASSTSMSTYNTSTLNAGPMMNQTTFNADDAWASIRDIGMTVPLDMHAPHMELLLDYHESAVAEMELIMEAEERSVTNLLQQL